MKKFWKKFLCFALVLSLLLCFAACDNGRDDDDEDEDEDKSSVRNDEDDKDKDNEDKDKDNDDEDKDKDNEDEDKEPSLDEQIVGDWLMEYDMSKYLATGMGESMGMDMSDYEDQLSLVLDIHLAFEDDGTCAFYVDEDKLEDSMGDFVENLLDVMVEVTYDMYEDTYTEDELEELFEEAYGSGIAEYYEELLGESLSMENIFDEIPRAEGYYRLDGDKVFITEDEDDLDDKDEYVVISIEDDELEMDIPADSDFDMDMMEELGLELPWIFERN